MGSGQGVGKRAETSKRKAGTSPGAGGQRKETMLSEATGTRSHRGTRFLADLWHPNKWGRGRKALTLLSILNLFFSLAK